MLTRLRQVLSSRPALLAISVLFTALALWLAVRKQDPTEVLDAIRQMPAWPFVFGFFGLVIGTLIRALRFHLIMRQSRSTFSASLEMILIGYFFTTILPLRTGELMRIGYFTRRSGSPVLATTTGIVVERMLDLIALAFMASIVLSGVVGRHLDNLPIPLWILSVAAIVGVIGAVGFGLIARHRILARTADAESRSARMLRQIASGLSALGSLKDALFLIGLSIGLWCVVSLSMKVAFTAVDLEIPFVDAAVIMLGTCFTIALPSTPGFVGTYHLGFVAGALLVGIPREIALPVGIVFHLVIQIPFLPIGGLILFTGGRKILAKPPEETSTGS